MRIYFLGICGTGMGNVALLMRDLGHEVFGADQHVYPPMSTVLEEKGILIDEGYSIEKLHQACPNIVVIGNAISRGNPVVEYLMATRSYAFCSLPELMSQEILKKRSNIVVTGTHGKTTTTAMTAFLLSQLGYDPGYLIGGVPQSLPSGAHIGSETSPFVIEGDEYDTAFFDKRSKFIHYLPYILIINNIEFDHADIFRDLIDVQRTFSHVTRIVPKSGFILANGDDNNITPLLNNTNWTNIIKVGTGENNHLIIRDYTDTPQGSEFKLQWHEGGEQSVALQVPGLFNARNAAMAALSAALIEAPHNPMSVDFSSLARYQGVKRRQECIYNDEFTTIIDDFAHHPTAIAGTLTALKAKYPDHELVACFEPRSNTSCRKIHQEELIEALSIADNILLAPVHRPHLYSEEDRLDIKFITEKLNSSKKESHYFNNTDELSNKLESLILSPKKKVVCLLTNGNSLFNRQKLLQLT